LIGHNVISLELRAHQPPSSKRALGFTFHQFQIFSGLIVSFLRYNQPNFLEELVTEISNETRFLHAVEMGLGAWQWGDRMVWQYGQGYGDFWPV
jgi:predicted TPR repeat methyltransferase